MKKITLTEDLAAFRKEVQGIAPQEPIYLDAHCTPAVLREALRREAHRVLELKWIYYKHDSVQLDLPPGLVALWAYLPNHSEFDFAEVALRQCPMLSKLIISNCSGEDGGAFFTALGQSSVTELEFAMRTKLYSGLVDYLQKDLLETLSVNMQFDADLPLPLDALRGCTKLKALELWGCVLPPTAFTNLPLTLTKLSLNIVLLRAGFDWSFLARSEVTDLELAVASDLDIASMCSFLTARLARAPMERLALDDSSVLPIIPFHRVQKLELESRVGRVIVEAIAAALTVPDNHLRELMVWSDDAAGLAHLEAAMRQPNCALTNLNLISDQWVAVRRMDDCVCKRPRILTLLQARINRLRSPLRRLPVEMFRLVGEM